MFWRRDGYAHASPAFSFWYNKGIRNIEGVCVYSLNVSNKLSVRDFAAYTELRSRAKHKVFDADNFSILTHTQTFTYTSRAPLYRMPKINYDPFSHYFKLAPVDTHNDTTPR